MKSSKPSGEAPSTARARNTPSPRAARAKVSKPADHSAAPISAEERRRMIELCAYFRAQQRGFTPGNELQDWYDAEAQVDAQLVRRNPPRRELNQEAS